MRALIHDLIPHAPQVGLYVAPNIPADKLQNALNDFAKAVAAQDVLAIFDATLMGSAKDGAVLTADRLIFQNNDLEPVHEVRYQDLIQAESRRKLLGGRRLVLTVNRGRATFDLDMDFSGKPDAAEYVLRFLREAMLRPEPVDAGRGPTTDIDAVSAALQKLLEDGTLTAADYEAVMRLLRQKE